MKHKLNLFFASLTVFTLALGACAPVTPQTDNGETPEVSNGGESPTPEVSQPEVLWEQAPEAIVIQGKNCCGFVPRIYVENYIADFTIWGDGRYIYVVQDVDSGQRTVYEAFLTPEQILAILEKVELSGFYTWEDRYANEMVADVPEKCLVVSLKSGVKGTCEYFEGAPEAFHVLYALLAGGANIEGKQYTPERGLVTSYLLGTAADGINQHDVMWDAAEMGFDLKDAVNGQWLEGEALAKAWEIVNMRPWGATIKLGEQYYNLSVQVAGLNPFGSQGQ